MIGGILVKVAFLSILTSGASYYLAFRKSSSYLNVGYEYARGMHVSSAQFLFDPDEFAYIRDHWVFLDHDQRFTGSAGIAYSWNDWSFSADALYGNGLRARLCQHAKESSLRNFEPGGWNAEFLSVEDKPSKFASMS